MTSAAIESEDDKGLSIEQLLTIYKLALDEYRSAVTLNWDRQKFFLTLNIAVVAASTSIFKLNPAPELKWILVLVFFLGICVAILGVAAVDVGHKYYRRTRDLFQAAEKRLGLPNDLVLRTTEGMTKTPRYGFQRLAKITSLTKFVLALLGAAELVLLVALLLR